jgi:hypothetical protein
VLLLQGCLDLRNFAGEWSGAIVAEEALLAGFKNDTVADPLVLSDVRYSELSATLTTSDGRFAKTRLETVTRYSADAFSTLVFDGNPARTYMLFGRLASESTGCQALALITLFGDDHVELRVIRGNELFGLFYLKRKE